MITFTTTATYRPELLEKTFNSFTKKIKDLDFSKIHLIINFDPLPIYNLNKKNDLIQICKNYFGKVTFIFSNKGNFPLALKHVWEKTETEYVFNLEDDWILLEDIKIFDLLKILEKNPLAIGVNLNAYLFNLDKYRIRLSPGILKGSWVRNVSKILTDEMCPEQQLRKKLSNEMKLPLLNYPEYDIIKNGRVIVKDIGREWRASKGLNRTATDFTTWK